MSDALDWSVQKFRFVRAQIIVSPVQPSRSTMMNYKLIAITLFIILLSAHMSPVPTGKKCKTLYKTLSKVIGSPKETPEKVTKVLKMVDLEKCLFSQNGSKTAYDWYLDLVSKAMNPGVAQIMMTRGAAVLQPHMVATFYESAVEAKLKRKSYHIIPDSTDHKIILSCLGNWASYLDPKNPREKYTFDAAIARLILDGNLAVLKSFVDHGCGLPRWVHSINEIWFGNPVDMVVYLFEHPEPTEGLAPGETDFKPHGYTAQNSQALLESLFKSLNFVAVNLQALFDKGLLLDGVCLDIALVHGRVDLAYAAYKQGLRLNSFYWLYSPQSLEARFRNLPLPQFAEYIARQNIITLVEANSAPDSQFYRLPKELVMGLISQFMTAVSSKDYMEILIEPI